MIISRTSSTNLVPPGFLVFDYLQSAQGHRQALQLRGPAGACGHQDHPRRALFPGHEANEMLAEHARQTLPGSDDWATELVALNAFSKNFAITTQSGSSLRLPISDKVMLRSRSDLSAGTRRGVVWRAGWRPLPGGFNNGRSWLRDLYLEIDRPRKLVFTWFTSEEEEQENNSVVTLTIEPLANGCRATIAHGMDERWAEYGKPTETAWAFMLRQIGMDFDADANGK